MNTIEDSDIQIVMPAHNEADCIEAVVRELYEELAARMNLEFIICEDGSTDGTKEILRRLSREIPMKLVMSDQRKGYSRAMIDGLRASTADYVLCLDSDGQYRPRDFWRFRDHMEDQDISIGWRKPRRDRWQRRVMSRCFGLLHAALFHVPLHDPSCGFLLIKHHVLDALVGELGTLSQGFQWEFIARAHARGFRMREIAVEHRRRGNGTTRVYHLHRLPGIVASHVTGLFRVWWETKRNACGVPDPMRAAWPLTGSPPPHPPAHGRASGSRFVTRYADPAENGRMVSR
jgi:glycosyltransferase involved in cell wall biosynthesis